MSVEELQKRIAKKEADIEKITKRVQKWDKGLSAEDEVAAWGTYREIKQYCKDHNFSYEKENQIIEYYRACSDLRDANTTLAKYKNQLALEISKSEATKIQPIVDFLNKWKQNMRDYIQEDIKNADKYYELNSKSCDLHNNRYSIIKEIGEEEWKKQTEEVRKNEKFYKEFTLPVTFEVRDKHQEDHINHEKLDEILGKEAESKYWNMVEKVTKITGEITDAKGLCVGRDGNLNGIIIGEDGKANVETIIAGGQNAGVIVNVKRGPVAHFRFIVNPIK